jgi:hypothetical protein
MCRWRDGCFESGSCTRGRDTFFCVAKRKYPKKRRPGCRLLPALRRFYRRLPKGTPVPLATCGIPAAPLRAIPDKTAGAWRGKRDVQHQGYGVDGWAHDLFEFWGE